MKLVCKPSALLFYTFYTSLYVGKFGFASLDSRPFMPLHLLYQRIALNYKGLGDIERMNDAYIKAIEIADSIHQSDINKQMSDFNARYHAAEKELAIAALRHEKSRRGMIIAILAGVIAATSLLLIIYLRSRRRKTELANIKARIEGIELVEGDSLI